MSTDVVPFLKASMWLFCPLLRAPGENLRFSDRTAAALCIVLFLKTSFPGGGVTKVLRRASSGKACVLFCFRGVPLCGSPWCASARWCFSGGCLCGSCAGLGGVRCVLASRTWLLGEFWPDDFARVDGVQGVSVCQSIPTASFGATPLPALLVLSFFGVVLGGALPARVSSVVLSLVCVSAVR